MQIVRLTLAREDYEKITSLLTDCGKSVEEGFAWLIGEGAHHYTCDQKVWESLSPTGTPEHDPKRLELQWREAVAHLLSMRARTLETEEKMLALIEQANTMTAEYREIRSRLFAMQEERRRLQMLLASSTHPRAEGPTARKGFWESIHRFLRSLHG